MYLWFQGLPGLQGMKVSMTSEDLIFFNAKMNTFCVSHHRATPAVCSESFRSKEIKDFPEHQDSLYVPHTRTRHQKDSRLKVFSAWCPILQGPSGPIGPIGPPGPRGTPGPKVSTHPPWRTLRSAADLKSNPNIDETHWFTGRSWSTRPSWREGEALDWEQPSFFMPEHFFSKPLCWKAEMKNCFFLRSLCRVTGWPLWARKERR